VSVCGAAVAPVRRAGTAPANVAVTLTSTKLRIATRNSPLALWQAEHVADLLRATRPDLEVVLVSTDTFGDRRPDLPIPELGGKGVFSKEIQQLVQEGEADLAVHSAKDLQALTPEDLTIAAVPERGDPRDAIVGCRLADLPRGATVATGSNRRSALLRDRRPDLEVVGLRGNIGTRLASVRNHDAIVMAATALDRLGLAPPVVERLDAASFVPQVGQGALAVEVRAADEGLRELVRAIDHRPTSLAVAAERAFLAELGGDCNLPAGAHAELVSADGGGDPHIRIRGVLAAADGGHLQRAVEIGPPSVDPGRVLACTLRKMLEAAPPTSG